MILKNLTITLCVLVTFGFHLQAQTLSGQVKDAETLENVPFAKIYILDLEVGIVADSLGRFIFTMAMPESVRLRVSSIGYESVIVRVNSGSSDLTAYLYSKHLEIEEVVVSGNQSTLQKYNVIHVETRKLSELNSVPGTNLMQLLEQIPGVYNASTGSGIAKPVIRGMQGMRVLTMLNGLRLENQQWGGDHGMGISEVGIGSVEVIKGPASLLYGADALGGVLYYSDETYAAVNSQSIKVQSVFHSNTNGGTLRMLYKQSNQKFRFLMGGSYANHADFQLPNQKFAQNSRFNESVLKAALSWNGKNKVHHLRYSFNHVMSGLPGHTHDSILNPLEFQSDIQRRKQTIPAQFFDNHYLSFENVRRTSVSHR